MLTTFVTLGFAHRAHSFEGLGDLLVQVDPVGDDHEGPVTDEFAQNLLREEHHREALTAALRLFLAQVPSGQLDEVGKT